MRKDIPYKLYDIIPSQQTMYFLLKYSIHKQVVQIPLCVTVRENLDIDILKKAFVEEIKRNDALRIRFVKADKQIKQYFLPEYVPEDIPVMHFGSIALRDEYFQKDAQKPVKLFKSVPYRFIIFTLPDGSTGMYMNVSHLVTDAIGGALFFSDLLGVYRALKNGTDMPEPLASYEEYIQTEFSYLANEKKHGRDRDWYIHYWKDNGRLFYAGIHGHDLLDKARKKDPDITVPAAYDPIHDKADIIKKKVSKELTEKIYAYCKEHIIPPEVMFLYGERAHASKVNYRAPDILNMLMCSRRATLTSKRVGGCLAQPLQLRTSHEETETFAQAVDKLSTCRNNLVRHMNFPYLEARELQQEIQHLSAMQGPSCLMFSWLPIAYAAKESGIDFDFTAYCMGRYVMPLYVFAVPNPKDGGTDFYYMRRSNFIKTEHIDLLHKNMISALEKGIANPDMTVGQLLDELEDFPWQI